MLIQALMSQLKNNICFRSGRSDNNDIPTYSIIYQSLLTQLMRQKIDSPLLKPSFSIGRYQVPNSMSTTDTKCTLSIGDQTYDISIAVREGDFSITATHDSILGAKYDGIVYHSTLEFCKIFSNAQVLQQVITDVLNHKNNVGTVTGAIEGPCLTLNIKIDLIYVKDEIQIVLESTAQTQAEMVGTMTKTIQTQAHVISQMTLEIQTLTEKLTHLETQFEHVKNLLCLDDCAVGQELYLRHRDLLRSLIFSPDVRRHSMIVTSQQLRDLKQYECDVERFVAKTSGTCYPQLYHQTNPAHKLQQLQWINRRASRYNCWSCSWNPRPDGDVELVCHMCN